MSKINEKENERQSKPIPDEAEKPEPLEPKYELQISYNNGNDKQTNDND